MKPAARVEVFVSPTVPNDLRQRIFERVQQVADDELHRLIAGYEVPDDEYPFD